MTLMIELGRYIRSIMCPEKIDYKQLLDNVFVISGIIKVVVVLSTETKAEADNTNRDLDYLGYHIN